MQTIPNSQADAVGIDFDSAEYGYVVTPADCEEVGDD